MSFCWIVQTIKQKNLDIVKIKKIKKKTAVFWHHSRLIKVIDPVTDANLKFSTLCNSILPSKSAIEPMTNICMFDLSHELFDLWKYSLKEKLFLYSNKSNQIFHYIRCYKPKRVTSLRGQSPRHCALVKRLLSKKCRCGGETLATPWSIWPARDLNCRSPASETNALSLDQLAGQFLS